MVGVEKSVADVGIFPELYLDVKYSSTISPSTQEHACQCLETITLCSIPQLPAYHCPSPLQTYVHQDQSQWVLYQVAVDASLCV